MMIVYMYLYEHGYDCLRWPNGLIIYIGDRIFVFCYYVIGIYVF